MLSPNPAMRARTRLTPVTLLILAILAAILGSALSPAPSAEALGCVLGPSLASAAKAVGVSCPSVDGAGGEPAWGAAGKKCTFGWHSEDLPSGLLSYFDSATATREIYNNNLDPVFADGKMSVTTFYRGGKTLGFIYVQARADRSVVIDVTLYGRNGLGIETVYFNCMESPYLIYNAIPASTPKVVPDPATPTTPVANSRVATKASMSRLGLSSYLIRVDLANTSTTKATFAEVHLGLAGYAVDGFPTLPREVSCQQAEGLHCAVADLDPGQTTTVVLLVHVDGSDEAAETIDITTTALGMALIDYPDFAPVRRLTAIGDSYMLARP